MSAKPIMAGHLLCGLVGVLIQGCLIPPDYQVLNDLPAGKNHRPSILNPHPQMETDLDIDISCRLKNVPFTASVEDLDITDAIRNRWFVDPDATFASASYDGVTVPGLVALPDGGQPNPVRETLIQAPSGVYLDPAFANFPGMTHQVTLVIADGEFLTGINVVPRATVDVTAPDGGTMQLTDPNYTATYTWIVQPKLAPCP